MAGRMTSRFLSLEIKVSDVPIVKSVFMEFKRKHGQKWIKLP